jgi:arachidonate 15-lipoxygenase
MQSPSLPQHDPSPEARRQAVSAGDVQWPVTYDRFTGVAMAPSVPPSDHPSDAWLAEVAGVLVQIGLNAAAVDRRMTAMHPDHPEHTTLIALVRDAARGGIHAALGALENFIQGGDDVGLARTLTDYEALFQRIPLPPSAATLRDDLWFAQMRVAGPNPMMLSRVQRLPEHLVVNEATIARAMASYQARGLDTTGGTLAAAMAEGRLFVADYAALQGAPQGVWGGRTKFLYAPIALFMTVGIARTLVPVAIQPGQLPAGEPMTPADGEAWQVAKTMTTVADGNIHQAVVHLGHTHLVLEACTLAARRYLASWHPLARLLGVHTEGTLYINDAADTKLAAPGGGVDAVMGGPISYSRAVTCDAVNTWSFVGSMLERELRARGVDDTLSLPDFPYRDDARLIWAALRRWIEAFVRTWYVTDADVHADIEVQTMFRWLGAPDGGRLRDVRVPATITDLVDAVTHIIFTGSAQHAAVNFPQLPVMAYAPAYPLAGYRAGPVPGAAMADWLSMLPPVDLAHYQATLGVLLGSVHHTQLGHYPNHLLHNFVGDPRITEPMEMFKRELDAISALIDQRNRARVPYTFLLPSRIPQSINI